MKALILIIILALLTGCVSATYRNGEQSVTYRDFFKKANDVQVKWGDAVTIGIGNMSSEITVEEMMTAMKVMGMMAAPTPVK